MDMHILTLAAGGVLLPLVWVWKLRELMELIPPTWPKTRARVEAVARVVVGAIAIRCLVDPLIPGAASLTIISPAVVPTVYENLRARVTPVPLIGEAAPDRARFSSADGRGIINVAQQLRLFETRVNVMLYDASLPSRVLVSTTFYVSPFVRMQLAGKTISFEEDLCCSPFGNW